MRLITLGGLRLEEGDLSRPKPLLLLCYLALEGAQTRRVLTELFFPDARDPRDACSTTLRRIRRIGDGLIVVDGERVRTGVACDAKDLLSYLDEGRLVAALELYGGAFMAGFDLSLGEELEGWMFATREYLAARVRMAHLSLGEQQAVQGEMASATRHAEMALVLAGAPELEPEQFGRVYDLLATGDSPRAAEVKAEAEAFGIDLTTTTEQPVWQPPAGSEQASYTAQNLPAQTTSFVGRDPELLEIAGLLSAPYCRLLTLHGPGGVGKSRLAIQAAHDQVRGNAFRDSVVFVPLDALTSAEQIPTSIATALGLTLDAGQEPLGQIKARLGEKRVLLILDNYEQLFGWVTLPTELIEACPNLKIVVTSRERLNLEEEHVLSLEGLPLPAEDSSFEDALYADAMQLLMQRAKKAQLDFRLDPEVMPAALKICRLVEGSPLGIELATAWVRLLPLPEICEEIERNLDFLESSARNAPERHHSLRAVFEHSWRLLSPKEQEVLARLSVFRGGFRREAASAVAGATLPLLASLVDKSLLRLFPAGRYDRHALLFQFTGDKLAERPEMQSDTQELHAGFYTALAEKVEPLLSGVEPSLYLDQLEEEHDNLRAALSWALERNQMELGLRLAGALAHFWRLRGYYREGRDWLERTLALEQTTPRVAAKAKVLAGAGWLAWLQGDHAAARPLIEGGLALQWELGDKGSVATSLRNLGAVARQQGDHVVARSLLEESLAMSRELGDKGAIASSLNILAIVNFDLGDPAAAHSLHEEGLALQRELGDRRGIAVSLNNLAVVAHKQGDFAAARSLLEESLVLQRELGDMRGVAYSLDTLGNVAHDQGDFAAACTLLGESLGIMRDLGEKFGMAYSLEDWAILQLSAGLPERAARIWGAAEVLRETIDAPLPPVERERYQRAVEEARNQLGEATFTAAWNQGRRLPLEAAVSYALGGVEPDAG